MTSLLKVSYQSNALGKTCELPRNVLQAFEIGDVSQRINALANSIFNHSNLSITSLAYNSDNSLSVTFADGTKYHITPIQGGIHVADEDDTDSRDIRDIGANQSYWFLADRIRDFALQHLMSQPAPIPGMPSGNYGQPQVIPGANGGTTVIYGPCCHGGHGGVSGSNCLPVLLQIQQDLSRIAAALAALEQRLGGSRTQPRAPADDRETTSAVPHPSSNIVHLRSPYRSDEEDDGRQAQVDALTQQLQQTRRKQAEAIAAAQRALRDD